MGTSRNNDGAPAFSVVVATRDRPRQLAACLAALARLDYARARFEVIVVDDGGRAPLDDVVASFRGPVALTLVRQANSGPGAARNAGAARARHPFLAFTDDDCLPEPGWLRAFAGALAAVPGRLLGGGTVNALTDNPYAEASQRLSGHLCAYHAAGRGQAPFFPTSNLAVPADRFAELGGFDAAFRVASEDRDLCDRWRRRDWAMAYVPDALVHHAHDLTAAGFWRQHFRYGRGAAHFQCARSRRHRSRGGAGAGGLRPEPPAFYWGLLRSPFVAPEARTPWTCSALIFASQLATATGFAWETARLGPSRRDSRGAARRGDAGEGRLG